MRLFISILLILIITRVQAQQCSGVVADEITHEPLPFAAIHSLHSQQGTVADINGKFSFNANGSKITITSVGHQNKTVSLPHGDTVFLQLKENALSEVVIRPNYDKIRRIINEAAAHKKGNNPEKYNWYSCNVYYKMIADIMPNYAVIKSDSDARAYKEFNDKSHLLISETYSRRTYRRPDQLQEQVIASRFSGLKKTLFTNLITGMIPFQIYDDEIKLSGNSYLNPIAKGWQSRYDFRLIDELENGADTTFIFSYKPKKGITFNSMEGTVYINSNQYAISHLTAKVTDTAAGRDVTIEQIYSLVNGKWFPKELNYDFAFLKYPTPEAGLRFRGHSIIDSVSFIKDNHFHFDKTYPVKLDDSNDLHSEEDWQHYRKDSVDKKERNTYVFIDSIAKDAGFNKVIAAMANLPAGRISVGKADVDITRVFAYNAFEKTRIGLGLYTNDFISRYFSVGGWFGYGFKDKVWKYGASLRLYPGANKSNWFDIAYQKNYQNSGTVFIHSDLDKKYLRNYLLQQPDLVTEYKAAFHGRFGYWQIDVAAKQQMLTPQYYYQFMNGDGNVTYKITEGSIGLRYAYAEKFTPVFGYYLSTGTKHPVLYLDMAAGRIEYNTYSTNYLRALFALNYKAHINRLGTENILLTAGIITTTDNKPLPRSLLLAGNGFVFNKRLNWYSFGGFETMLPYAYYSDQFAAIHFRHDFDKSFYKTQYSSPYLSLAHNILYGTLSNANRLANNGIAEPKMYHETGLILNRLLRLDYLHVMYIDFNFGGFYHYNGPFDWQHNGQLVAGITGSY